MYTPPTIPGCAKLLYFCNLPIYADIKIEDKAIEKLNNLYYYWMPYVDNTTTFPIDCVYTGREPDTIDWYKVNVEITVSENEGLWLKNGGPTDEEREKYINTPEKNAV